MQRYTGETERLVGILDNQLKDTDYLVGNKYSIADIASFGWINMLIFSGIEIDNFPNLKAWCDRINSRPAVKAGLLVPAESQMSNNVFKQKMKDDPETAEKQKTMMDQIKAAKEKYNYKYSSP
jgi:glutathione S-transferase